MELQERHLVLAQRRAATDTLRHELETTPDLLVKGYVTQSSYDRTRNDHEEARLRLEEAEIQLEETKLSLLKNATKISVREARKYELTVAFSSTSTWSRPEQTHRTAS